MVQIGSWKKVENRPTYQVWQRPSRKGFNTFAVVVKKEDRQWVSFVDVGAGGTQTLKRGGTKQSVTKKAKSYMRKHPKN